MFTQFCKTFCVFILMHILFYGKNKEKRCTERNKIEHIKAYLLTEETSFWFPLTESLKITCDKSYAWLLNFYQMERVWIVFRGMSNPNWVK